MKRSLASRLLHPVGLGCMNLSWAYGTPPPRDYAERLLNRALDIGCDHLDTARIYGGGKNEAMIGETLKGRRKEFFIASKTGIVVDGPRRGVDCSPEHVQADIEKSLELLQTDFIDLYYLHRFDPKVPIADSVGALSRAIEAGKIGAYGVSEWSAAHIREAHAVHPMAAVQTEYSLWTRNVELGVLDACRDLGIALVAFSPTARGALGGKLRDPSKFEENDLRNVMPRFNAENWPHNLRLVDQFDALAKEAGVAPAQLANRWVLERDPLIHVIPGTTSIEHMEENHAAASVTIAHDVLERAGEIINHATVWGHRYHDAIRPTIDTEEFEPA